ncbi:anti-sigma factor [uncultured Microbacterium sp.]|uniref:anti-sigma factor n=1 Tax=uncultured Microbacterium sp. TaxID=191216 RepID=UPI0025DC0C27|nr:anti-sigma factor [uncultured Microbacterium sp.]
MSEREWTREEFAEQSAAYALGALSPDERANFERALATHPEWQSIVDEDVDASSSLAFVAGEVAPPAALRSSILASIAEVPQEGAGVGRADVDARAEASVADRSVPEASVPESSVPEASGPQPVLPADAAPEAATAVPARAPRRGSRTWFALAACIALIVAVAIGTPAVIAALNPPTQQTALAHIQSQPDAQSASADVAGGGTLTVHWSPALGQAVAVPEGLGALSSDQTYELWLVRDGGAIPAGTFTEAGADGAVVDGALRPGDVVAVTVEQAGGSPTGQPTTTPIVAVPTA